MRCANIYTLYSCAVCTSKDKLARPKTLLIEALLLMHFIFLNKKIKEHKEIIGSVWI